MPATLEAGTIYGYCVGEPWNQQAVFKGIGVPVVTDYEIWKNNPEKVFGITKAFSEKYPNISRIYSSPLKRTLKTAEALAERANVPLEHEHGFREFSIGKLEGLPYETLAGEHRMFEYMANDHHYAVDGGELDWMESYLIDHHHHIIIINSKQADQIPLQYGFPQGSTIGPFDFKFYTKPLTSIARKHSIKIHLYADHNQLYIPFDLEDSASAL